MQNKVISWILAVIVALALSSCQQAWNAVNRSALENDVDALLVKCGIEQRTPVSCSMVGETRDGVCELELATPQVIRLVEGLNLDVLDPNDPQHSALLSQLKGSSPTCLQPDDDTVLEQAWIAIGRPPELRLESGSAFEFLLVLYRQSESYACLQLSYSYG